MGSSARSDVRFAEIDGVRLAYRCCGEGRPVLFIHGLGESLFTWRHVVGPLSGGFATVAVDLMGFGRSNKPAAETYTTQRQSHLVLGLIEELCLERPVLVGHSYGGAVCLDIARRAVLGTGPPISGMALLAPACYPDHMPLGVRLLRLPGSSAWVRLLPARPLTRLLMRMAFENRSAIEAEAVDEYAECASAPGARRAFVAAVRRIVPPDVDARVADYRRTDVPALVVWGRGDRILPLAHGERLSADLPRARLAVLDACGHSPQEERPGRTVDLLAEFLDGPAASSAAGSG